MASDWVVVIHVWVDRLCTTTINHKSRLFKQKLTSQPGRDIDVEGSKDFAVRAGRADTRAMYLCAHGGYETQRMLRPALENAVAIVCRKRRRCRDYFGEAGSGKDRWAMCEIGVAA